MIINPYLFGASLDPDAQAFITAAGITNPTQQGAINTLVLALKGYSIWTKFKAIYPIVGGTASAHAVNLKTPGTYNMSFATGVTHSSTGMISGGAGYADTNLNQSLLSQNSTHLSFYSRTNLNTNQAEIGIHAGNYNLMQIRVSGTAYYLINTPGLPTVAEADSRGFFIGNRQASNDIDAWKNGVKILNGTTASGTVASGNLFLLAYNNIQGGGGAAAVSTKECAFASIGDGLTDTDGANFYTAVQAYQTTLGRSIGPQTVSDADAQAFVTNAGIVDQVEANAINNLVIGMKADGLWTKMQAVYPFVGGTATTHKFNLKNPLDTDAAFRLVFNGGWTHSSTGALPNGTNAWANTYLTTQATLGLNSTSFGVYSRTNTNTLAPAIGNVTGAAPGECSLWLNFGNAAYLRVNSNIVSNIANFDSKGLFIANRVNSTQVQLQIRGTQTTFANASQSTYPQPFQLGGVNPNNFDNKQLAFAFIGDGLTAQNMTDLNTAVVAFQTALSRNV
jgi:hypothetical protein